MRKYKVYVPSYFAGGQTEVEQEVSAYRADVTPGGALVFYDEINNIITSYSARGWNRMSVFPAGLLDILTNDDPAYCEVCDDALSPEQAARGELYNDCLRYEAAKAELDRAYEESKADVPLEQQVEVLEDLLTVIARAWTDAEVEANDLRDSLNEVQARLNAALARNRLLDMEAERLRKALEGIRTGIGAIL